MIAVAKREGELHQGYTGFLNVGELLIVHLLFDQYEALLH